MISTQILTFYCNEIYFNVASATRSRQAVRDRKGRLMSIIGGYGYVLLFFVAAFLFVFISIVLAYLLQPRNPYPAKETTYECGEVPVGVAWIRFNVCYYIFALIFVIFDVEAAFLFPWAVVLRDLKAVGLGSFAVLEMTVFILILFLGLIYAWRKGALKWN